MEDRSVRRKNFQNADFQPCSKRDVESLRNWLDGTGCLARKETGYLDHQRELICLAPVADSAVMQLEAWVEDKLIRYYRVFRKVRRVLGYYKRLTILIEPLS
jgi:hypothetical protein